MTTPPDMRPKMRDAVVDTAATLARLRGVTQRDAMEAIASTYQENLSLSLGTADEWYWRRMLEVVHAELGTPPIRSLPRGDQ